MNSSTDGGMYLYCLGPEGSFSHALASHLTSRIVTLKTISEVFASVDDNSYGLVPIENSSGGFIYETVDCLMRHKDVNIIEHIPYSINLALMRRKGDAHSKPTKILSHAMPFFHCDEWLNKWYKDVERVIYSSTSAAAKYVSESNEPGVLAICSVRNAEQYGLELVSSDIGSDKLNVTEFYLIAKNKHAEGDLNRTVMLAELEDTPGEFQRFLLQYQDTNLKRVLMRAPNFYIELEGSVDTTDPRVKRINKFISNRKF